MVRSRSDAVGNGICRKVPYAHHAVESMPVACAQNWDQRVAGPAVTSTPASIESTPRDPILIASLLYDTVRAEVKTPALRRADHAPIPAKWRPHWVTRALRAISPPASARQPRTPRAPPRQPGCRMPPFRGCQPRGLTSGEYATGDRWLAPVFLQV